MKRSKSPGALWNMLILLLTCGMSACGGGGGGAGTGVPADTTAPAISLAAVATPTALATQMLSGTVEVGASVTVELLPAGSNGPATVAGGSWTYQLNDLREGANSVRIVVRDASGNSSTPLLATIVRDSLAPELTLSTPPARIRTGQLMLQGGINETAEVVVTNASGLGAVLGQVSYPTATSWQLQVTGMAEGSHQFNISATDGLGNPSSAIIATVIQDSTAPALPLGQVNPAAGSTDINILEPIRFTFSEEMDPTTLTAADPAPTVLVVDGLGVVPGTITTSDGLTFTFTPGGNYDSDSDVSVTVSVGATDLAGNPMAAPVQWSFRTSNAPPPPPL